MQGLISAFANVKTTVGAVIATLGLLAFVVFRIVQGEFETSDLGLGVSYLASMWIGLFSGDAPTPPDAD